jgi:hypothetical protein
MSLWNPISAASINPPDLQPRKKAGPLYLRIPSEVVLTESEDGMLSHCAANTDNIQTIQKANLDAFITHLSQARMREVRAAIEFALGFDALR